MKKEIILLNTYDTRYWNVFAEGVFVEDLYKMTLSDYLFRRKNIKELMEFVGVKNEEDLVFTIFNVEELPEIESGEYYADDLQDFTLFESLKKQHNLKPELEKVTLDFLEDYL